MEFPFKEYDGIHKDKSTVEQREEIYSLCEKLGANFGFESNYDKTKDNSLVILDDKIYNAYGWGEETDGINHIPFEEFKQRLLDYEKSLTNK